MPFVVDVLGHWNDAHVDLAACVWLSLFSGSPKKTRSEVEDRVLEGLKAPPSGEASRCGFRKKS
jgi:hypothetical protein